MNTNTYRDKIRTDFTRAIGWLKKHSQTEYASNFFSRHKEVTSNTKSDFSNVIKYFKENLDIVVNDFFETLVILWEIEETKNNTIENLHSLSDFLKNRMPIDYSVLESYLREKFECDNENIISVINDLLWIHAVRTVSKGITRPSLTITYDDESESPLIRDYSNNVHTPYNKDYFNKNTFFRGQSHSEWKLIPSFFRSLSEGIHTIDYDFLVKDYERNYLIAKYSNVFKSSKLDYGMISYMQHSVSYSPFLDMTSEFSVALSFALNYLPPVEYNKTQSAIYSIVVDEKEVLAEKDISDIEKLIEKYEVLSINKKIAVARIIGNQLWVDLIKKKSNARIWIIDYKANDRMKYQAGVFALFDNFIIVGDRMLIPDSISNRFKKYEIDGDRELKNKLKEWIRRKYSHYQHWYLLDPYLYFKIE